MSKPLLALIVALLAAIAYANALGNGFVWDDPIILTRQLPVFRTLGSVFAPPPNIPQFAPDYYRPLVIASYLVDRAIAGENAHWFHLTLLLAHIAASIGVFALGGELLRRAELPADVVPSAAAIGAALFAVHPIHTEAVAWIAGRADVFAGLFAVVALWAHLRSRAQIGYAWIAGAAWLLALLSKEVAVSVAVVLLLSDALLRDDAPAPAAASEGPRSQRRRSAPPPALRKRNSIRDRYLALGLALALYSSLRLAAIGTGLTTRSAEMNGSPFLGALAASGVYARKLLAPYPLNAYIATLPTSAGGIALGIVALGVFAAALARAWRSGARVAVFLLLWIAVTLAPAYTILFKIPEVPIAERYLYLPSVGFCLLAGWLAGRGLAAPRAALRRATLASATVILVAALGLTMRRNRIWASDLALWTDTAAATPEVGMPLRSLAGVHLRAGRFDEAERAYEQSLALFNTASGKVTILSNLGTIALQRGDLDRAEASYRRAIEVQASPDALYNLGVISLRRAQAAQDAGNLDERVRRAQTALADLQRAESGSPYDPEIQVAIGQALSFLDRGDESRARYRKALSLGLSGESAARVKILLGDGQKP